MTDTEANNDLPTVDQRALIKIAPERDYIIQALYSQGIELMRFAEKRVITCDQDLMPATDDLAIIAGLIKKLEAKKKEYIDPINAHLAAFREVFNRFMQPLTEANAINRDKVTAYNAAVKKRAADIAEVNRQALELARRQAELSGGEFTVDTTQIAAPIPVQHVRTDMGTAGTVRNRKYRVVNFAELPDQYKIENSALLNKVVKAGIPEIKGVEIYFEDSLRVTLR